ncbi:MAG: hypothetical protein M0Z48_02625, partial [Nitrospiraceae bacterium]|nr:hypothetical protein [Nitrospiraceae bacterium]
YQSDLPSFITAALLEVHILKGDNIRKLGKGTHLTGLLHIRRGNKKLSKIEQVPVSGRRRYINLQFTR